MASSRPAAVSGVVTRRAFLGAGLGMPALAACAAPSGATETRPAGTLDIHVHLFGTGDGDTGCRLSPQVQGGATFAILVRLLRLRGASSLDERYREVMVESLRGAGVDCAAVLAQDAVYDARGRRDDARTHFYVPNDYVLETCAAHADRMIPCVSINPDRRDAVDELERCHARGARVLKIHPPTQGVDVADPKHARFFRRCADLGHLVMVHTGHEHAAPVIDISLADPRRLAPALEAGCRVVACHSGSGWRSDTPDFLPHFVELARSHERLWGDTSVLCTSGRVRDLARLLDSGPVRERLVHGSDFPFPANPIAFADRVGRRRALELTGDRNLIRRDYLLKRELGMQDCTERAYRLLHDVGALAWTGVRA